MSEEGAMAREAGAEAPTVTIRLWDPAVRVFHWALMVLLVLCYISAELGRVQLHMGFGLAVLGLLVFRVLWGFLGSPAARFTDFVPPPSRLFGYLADLGAARPSRWPGHNPLGGLAVLAILAMLAVHVTFGLFIQDVDYMYAAPLAYQVSNDAGLAAGKWHGFTFDILLILAAVHLLAVAYYAVWKKENLVTPMVTGRKQVAAPAADKADFSLPRFLVCAILAAAVVYAITRFW